MSGETAQHDDRYLAETGARIRAARAKAGVTRKQLAAASGASERYLAHLEAGAGNPSLSILGALAAALDMPLAELLPLGGERDDAFARAAATLRRVPPERLQAFHVWASTAVPRDGQKARRIVLIGLRGAGKSSLGEALAKRLGMAFVEMSREVEAAYGGDIGLLIELGGQGALRRYERQAWDGICQRHESAVIAASGGVVADAPLYDRLLSTAHSIWLQARPEDHMARVMAQGDFRPMTSQRGAMTDLKAILDARAQDYARADLALDTSAQDFDTTLDRLEMEARRLVQS